MKMLIKLPFFTLLLLISFASVNAVLFTPALPNMTSFFGIEVETAQQTITWFLVGYALGQLIYGPIANRLGRKPALYVGISLQIISSLLCVVSGALHCWWLLIVGRFLLALGAGVGLKMTFTLVNECYTPQQASQKIAYLMLAFAITPGLGIALGGFLNTWYGWESCFYAGAVYGIVLLVLVRRLPETLKNKQLNALHLPHLVVSYSRTFAQVKLVLFALLMGCSTCFIYVFSAVAPFLAIDTFGLNSAQYGLANLIPPCGLVLGSLVSARMVVHYSIVNCIRLGIVITSCGVACMMIGMLMHWSALVALFLPMVVVYFGLCFIMANASTLAMLTVEDKAQGSAVMSFINMGSATLVVLSLGLFSIHILLLPAVFMSLCAAMASLFWLVNQYGDRFIRQCNYQ